MSPVYDGYSDDGECVLGVEECVGGEPVCVGDKGPIDETCDGLDNDCDGLADEDFPGLGENCSVGVGQCATHGLAVCRSNGSGLECDAVPGEPDSRQGLNDLKGDFEHCVRTLILAEVLQNKRVADQVGHVVHIGLRVRIPSEFRIE